MITKRKWMIGAAMTLTVALAVPLVLSAVSAHPTSGYFEGGRCVCGHDIFIHIQGDGYFRYSPGHGVPERRSFTIRQQGDEWEVMGLPHSDLFWSPLEGENKVIGRLRFRDGALFESWGNSTNWTRRARVHNLYPIWIAKWLGR